MLPRRPTHRPSTLAPPYPQATSSQLGLAQVAEIESAVARGDHVAASQARRTLNELCCEWSPDLGRMSYPSDIRAALRAAGLSEAAS